jgi:hypothetical protein
MKNDTQADQKIRALTEMHASKVRTLLKSIQNLKKELQKEKFEKLDNVRVKKIQALEKEIELMEIGMNAIRKVVNNEDACDRAITEALAKGPKRVRVASREEILKNNGIKAPTGIKVDQNAGTGLTEDKGLGIYDITKLSEHSQMAQEDGVG